MAWSRICTQVTFRNI
uniref:Uncharacterized protein n=1 Tax=Anguilla anguilla TaxID=7936 RepID=A0A0E9PPH5_ANGAN